MRVNNFDPTRPYYEQAMVGKQADPHDEFMKSVFTYIKVSNTRAFFAWDEDAYSEATKLISECGLDLGELRQALQRLKSSAEAPTFPLFKSIVAVLKEELSGGPKQHRAEPNPNDWREKEIARSKRQQERERLAPKAGSKAIKTYWVKHINHDLEKNDGVFKVLR